MNLARFVHGLFAPLAGWIYLGRSGRRTRFCLIPSLFGACVAAVALFVLVKAAVGATDRIAFDPSWWGTGLRYLTRLVAILAALVGTAVTTFAVQSLASPWWYGRELERVERELGVTEKELQPVPVIAEVKDTIVNLSILAGINLVLFAVPWIPIVGPVAGPVFGWYFNAFYLGLECMDYPLALRGKRRTQKIAYAKSDLGFTLGLGTVLIGVGWIPLIGSACFACGIIGSTIALRDRTAKPTKVFPA